MRFNEIWPFRRSEVQILLFSCDRRARPLNPETCRLARKFPATSRSICCTNRSPWQHIKHDVCGSCNVEACMYNLIFCTTERGDSPLDVFLDGFDKKSRAKVAAYLSLLEEQGPNLKRPYADIVGGKIGELRIHYSSNQFRILYFFQCLIRLCWCMDSPRKRSN